MMKKVIEENIKIVDEYKDGTLSTLDGIAVEFPEWRFSIRTSNTEPLLRLNIEGKTTDPLCVIENKNVTLYANVSSGVCIGDVTFSVLLNDTWINYSGVPSAGLGNYKFILDSSLLTGGENINWTVYADDCYNHTSRNGDEIFHINHKTDLIVSPLNPDGENSWYISEPLFTLNNIDALNLFYRWDSEENRNYTGSFGLENIPNSPPLESAGILDLYYWSDVCSESEQGEIFKVDLVSPSFTDFFPENLETTIEQNITISAVVDEVFQSNSGLNESSVLMELDGVPVIISATEINSRKTLIEYNAENLSFGTHEVYIYAEDNAGRNNETTWEFEVLETGLADLIVNSPLEDIYTERRVPINATATETLDMISFIDLNSDNLKEKILCGKNCDGYGHNKIKTLSFKDGKQNITLIGKTISGEIIEKNLEFTVDYKTPKIKKTEPKKGFTNGNFLVEFREENPVELKLIYGNDSDKRQEMLNISECLENNDFICETNVDLSDFNNQEIKYYFNLTDIAGRSDVSKELNLDVDIIIPVIENFYNETDERRINFVFEINETNFDKITYLDSEENNPREKTFCSKLKDNICEKKISFRQGFHNLTFFVKDKAGNEATELFSFSV